MKVVVPPEDGSWVEEWLSTPRFTVYLQACGGDRSRALALYRWNGLISQALLGDLGDLEVALRNAYDRTISEQWQGTQHWLLDPESPVRKPLMRRQQDVNARRRAQIDEAVIRAGGRDVLPGKVIAELPFGFWRFLTAASWQDTLWMPYLRYAFPRRTARAEVDHAITELNQLRNRIAHHENLLSRDLKADHELLLNLVELIGPKVAQLIRASGAVSTQLSQRP